MHFLSEVTNVAARNEFQQLLNKELQEHHLSINGNLSIRREHLLERMKLEHKLKVLKMKYDYADIDEKSFYCMQDACSCILHMENRVNITFLQMLLLEGYSNCDDVSLNSDISRTVKARFLKYARDIEEIINTKILDDELNPAQFRFPYNKKQDNIGTIRISNPIARLIIDNVDVLIDITCTDNSRKELWKRAMGNAAQAMIILRKRTNYTETEILQFQEYYDLFAQNWIVLWGQAGMTNYIHIAISEHISDNMTHFKCMY